MHLLVSVDRVVCVEVRSRPNTSSASRSGESRQTFCASRSSPTEPPFMSKERYRGHYLVQAFCFVFIITSLSRLFCGKMTAFKARGDSESSNLESTWVTIPSYVTPCMTAPFRETNLNGTHCKTGGSYLLQSGATHVLFQSIFILYFGNDG